jgi:hypothetical protein
LAALSEEEYEARERLRNARKDTMNDLESERKSVRRVHSILLFYLFCCLFEQSEKEIAECKKGHNERSRNGTKERSELLVSKHTHAHTHTLTHTENTNLITLQLARERKTLSNSVAERELFVSQQAAAAAVAAAVAAAERERKKERNKLRRYVVFCMVFLFRYGFFFVVVLLF